MLKKSMPCWAESETKKNGLRYPQNSEPIMSRWMTTAAPKSQRAQSAFSDSEAVVSTFPVSLAIVSSFYYITL